MQSCDFETLKDYILDKNRYFNKGYADVYKDAVLQGIYTSAITDRQCVFPNDALGDYFYLRQEPAMRHEAMQQERITDNGTQRLVFMDSIIINLVAVVDKAQALVVIDNLRNTLMSYSALSIEPVNSYWNREQIVADELAGMKAENIQAALQRLKNETIVKIAFRTSKLFVPSDCINNPCK